MTNWCLASSALPETANAAFPGCPRPRTVRPITHAPRGGSALRHVCIASSTGGPNALSSIFQHLRAPLPVPLVLVQHMPPLFTALLAERLNTLGACRVTEARDGEVIKSGQAYIAPGGHHMEFIRPPRGRFQADRCPPGKLLPSGRRCSVSQCRGLLRAIRRWDWSSPAWVRTACAAPVEIVERGGVVMAQDEASSVVWGMPGQRRSAWACRTGSGLSEIPDALQDWLRQHLARRYAPAKVAS